jgi:hypothetical protein
MHSYILFLCLILLPALPVQAEVPYLGYSDYQLVTDFSFDPSSYFLRMQEYGVNFQRIWALGYSGAWKGERLPFLKKGGRYDLNRIDPEYVSRLRLVLQAAEQHNQRVLLTLFDNWSLVTDTVFEKTPWHYTNNTDRLLKKPLPDFYDLRNKKVRRIQENFVRTIVSATSEFGPIYEVMNEAALRSDCGLLHSWHRQMAEWIQKEYADAEIAVNLGSDCPAIYEESWVDLISLHAGDWMEEGICESVRGLRKLKKQIVIDTDGAWKERDDNRLVRQWLREAFSCGASFNHKDDIYKLDLQALELFAKRRQSESER